MASIWTMKKQELVEELEQYEVLFSSTDTVGELRQLLKEVRSETTPKQDNPAQGLTALKKQELLEKGLQMGLSVTPDLNRSQLISNIREHLSLSASFDSREKLNFGKYKEMTMEEIYSRFPEYAAWAQDNAGPGSCHALKRFVNYVNWRNEGNPPTTAGAASSSHAPSTPEPVLPVETTRLKQSEPPQTAPKRTPQPKFKAAAPPPPPPVVPQAKVQSTRRTRDEPGPTMEIDASNRLSQGTESELLQVMRAMMQRMENLESQVQSQARNTSVPEEPEDY